MSSAISNASAILDFCRQHQAGMLDLLRRMVEMESPSDNKASVDALGGFLESEFCRCGGKVAFSTQKEFGDHLKAEFVGNNSKPVLLLGHMDTVWSLGSLRSMPFRVDSARAFGPGIYDMKAGIVMMVFALRALAAERVARPPVTVLLDSDEEVGSPTGRSLVEATARECQAALVLEPSQGPVGHLKTARKGVGDYTIRVRGRASHSGVDFKKGRSAVVELARQILEITKFTDAARGITVNPGLIQGGTRSNVVAAEAWAEVDIRIARASDAQELEQRFQSLRAFDSDCSLEISGGLNRPPMERTDGTVRLFRLAEEIGLKLGMKLDEASTGGGSDGNFTSALGIPTLDGLGAVGEGAHAMNESIMVEEMPRRTALLACLIQSL